MTTKAGLIASINAKARAYLGDKNVSESGLSSKRKSELEAIDSDYSKMLEAQAAMRVYYDKYASDQWLADALGFDAGILPIAKAQRDYFYKLSSLIWQGKAYAEAQALACSGHPIEGRPQ